MVNGPSDRAVEVAVGAVQRLEGWPGWDEATRHALVAACPIIRAEVIAEVVEALRAVPAMSLDTPLSWQHAAEFVEREFGA